MADYSRIYRTGDYARIVKGIVIYEGRTDSQIKIRGHRVDLSEVERAVAASPAVDKAVVLCYKPGELSQVNNEHKKLKKENHFFNAFHVFPFHPLLALFQALVSFVTPRGNTLISGLQIESHLETILPSYMVPHVIVIDSIPQLVNGKTDRQTLLKQYELLNNGEKID